MKLRYTIQPSSMLDKLLGTPRRSRQHHLTKRVAVESLARNRSYLNNDHGEDPLKETLEVSRQAWKEMKQRRAIQYSPGSDGKGKPKLAPPKPDAPTGAEVGAVPRMALLAELEDDDDAELIERGESQLQTGFFGATMVSKYLTYCLVALLSRPTKRPRGPARIIPGEPPPDPGIFDDQGRVIRRLRWTEEEKQCVKEGVKKFGIGRWSHMKKEYGEILRNRTGVQIKDAWRTMTKTGEVASIPGASPEPTSRADIGSTPTSSIRSPKDPDSASVSKTAEI
jgi:hypothetical protein